MTLLEKQFIFAQNLSKLIDHIFKSNFLCTVNEVYRDPRIAQLNANSGSGIKNSLHCQKLAVDLNLFNTNRKYLTEKSDYEQFGIYWESLHPLNRWGGKFSKLVDSNHFEMQDK